MNKDTLNCIISSSDGIPLLSFSHSKNNSEANENNITRLAVTMNSFLPGVYGKTTYIIDKMFYCCTLIKLNNNNYFYVILCSGLTNEASSEDLEYSLSLLGYFIGNAFNILFNNDLQTLLPYISEQLTQAISSNTFSDTIGDDGIDLDTIIDAAFAELKSEDDIELLKEQFSMFEDHFMRRATKDNKQELIVKILQQYNDSNSDSSSNSIYLFRPVEDSDSEGGGFDAVIGYSVGTSGTSHNSSNDASYTATCMANEWKETLKLLYPILSNSNSMSNSDYQESSSVVVQFKTSISQHTDNNCLIFTILQNGLVLALLGNSVHLLLTATTDKPYGTDALLCSCNSDFLSVSYANEVMTPKEWSKWYVTCINASIMLPANEQQQSLMIRLLAKELNSNTNDTDSSTEDICGHFAHFFID